MIPHDLMAPLMFGGLVVFMLIGYPVSFSLAAVGLFFGFIAIEQGLFQFSFMQALPERIFGILSNDTLLAIPFFTLMGAILDAPEDDVPRLAYADWLEEHGYDARAEFIRLQCRLACVTGSVAASIPNYFRKHSDRPT